MRAIFFERVMLESACADVVALEVLLVLVGMDPIVVVMLPKLSSERWIMCPSCVNSAS